MSERLSDVFDTLIRPDFLNVKIIRHDGTAEAFDPLTLLTSLLESEVDLHNATKIFDDVVGQLAARAGSERSRTLTHLTIHEAVSRAIQRHPHPQSPFWLSNYEGMFAPELTEVGEDADFIDARNASVLRAEIREFLTGKRRDLRTDHADLTQITNRVLRLIRFCGFYKVRRKFLLEFLQELATSSSKAYIPDVAPDTQEVLKKIEEAEMMRQVAGGLPGEQQLNVSRLIVNSTAAAILGWLGVMYSPDTAEPMRQVRALFHDLYGAEDIVASTAEGRASLAAIRDLLDKRFEVASVRKDLVAAIDGLNAAVGEEQPHDILFFADRTLWYVRQLVAQDDFTRGLAQFDPGAAPAPYVEALSQALENNGFTISRRGDRWLDIELQHSFNKILEYGARVRLFVAQETGKNLDEFDFGFLQAWADESPELVFCIVFYGDLGGAFLENLKQSTQNLQRLIAPVRRRQLEQQLLRGEDIRTLILTEFLRYYPQGAEWQESAVFHFEEPTLPTHLRARERSIYLNALRSIGHGPGAGDTLQAFLSLESRIREHVLLVWSLSHHLNTTSVLGYAELNNGMEMQKLIAFLRDLQRDTRLPAEIQRLCVSPKILIEIDYLRGLRNLLSHNDLNLDQAKASDAIHRTANVSAYLNFMTRDYNKIVSSEAIPGVYVYTPLTASIARAEGNYWPIVHKSNLATYRFGYLNTAKPQLRFAAHVKCTGCRRRPSHLVTVALAKRFPCPECKTNTLLEGDWAVFSSMAEATTGKPLPARSARMALTSDQRLVHMRGWLRSLAEGLVIALGPIGAPLKVLTERLNSRDLERLESKIDELLRQNAAPEAASEPLREIGIPVAQAVLVARWAGQRNLPRAGVDASTALRPVSASLTDERELIDELARIYPELEVLRTDYRRVGIDISRVRRTDIPNVDVESLVLCLRGQTIQTTLALSEQLFRANPGSTVLANLNETLSTFMGPT